MKLKIPDIGVLDIVLDNVPIRKLHNVKIILFGKESWEEVPAHFHVFSEKDNYHGSLCLFSARYYNHKDNFPHIKLSQKQLIDLDKFLRKPHSFKTRMYESNWTYMINSHQDICERVNIGIDKDDQPDYTKTIPIEVKNHLSAPVKICEFDKYDVVVYKETMNQPHFHLISKDYKIDYPIQLFTYGQYILHPGCNIHQKMTIEECMVFNEWMSTHWDMIKTKFFEVNSFKKYESKYPETWKLMNTMSAPNYTNMITYEDLIEAETLEII